MSTQELEWRRLYQASIVARERLRRAEAAKARIMDRLERLEESMMAQAGINFDGDALERTIR